MPAVQDDSQRNRRTAKRILAIGLPLVVIAGTGIGYAYWTAGGSGTGTATTDAGASNLTIAGNTVSGLAPGLVAKALTATVTNGGTGTVKVPLLNITLSVTKASGAVAGTCDATDYTLSATTLTTSSPDIAPTATSNYSGADISFNNKSTNQDQCKGASVTVTYTAP